MTKLRVIQSNDNGFLTSIGSFCYSGLKSFTDVNPRESRLTMFIHKTDHGVDVSVFESVLTDRKNELGQYEFVCVTTPVIKTGVDTQVHLMSSLEDKMKLVDYVLS